MNATCWFCGNPPQRGLPLVWDTTPDGTDVLVHDIDDRRECPPTAEGQVRCALDCHAVSVAGAIAVESWIEIQADERGLRPTTLRPLGTSVAGTRAVRADRGLVVHVAEGSVDNLPGYYLATRAQPLPDELEVLPLGTTHLVIAKDLNGERKYVCTDCAPLEWMPSEAA